MSRPPHQVTCHRSVIAGVDAFTLNSARAFPRHTHDQFGLGLMVAGGQRSWSGVGQVEAAAGDVITVNPGEVHDGIPIRDAERRWRMVYLDPAVVARACDEGSLRGGEIISPAMRDPILADLLARLFAAIDDPDPEPLAVEDNLSFCLERVRRQHWNTPARTRGYSPAIGRAKERIDDDPAAGVSLSELAAIAQLSRFQLVRGFARELGLTPHAYVMQQRVRLARHLVRADRPLAETALEAGFADQSHMSRAFVRQLGVTPGRYRAAMRAGPVPQSRSRSTA